MPRSGLRSSSGSCASPASGVSWRIAAGMRANCAHWMNSVSGRCATKLGDLVRLLVRQQHDGQRLGLRLAQEVQQIDEVARVARRRADQHHAVAVAQHARLLEVVERVGVAAQFRPAADLRRLQRARDQVQQGGGAFDYQDARHDVLGSGAGSNRRQRAARTVLPARVPRRLAAPPDAARTMAAPAASCKPVFGSSGRGGGSTHEQAATLRRRAL